MTSDLCSSSCHSQGPHLSSKVFIYLPLVVLLVPDCSWWHVESKFCHNLTVSSPSLLSSSGTYVATTIMIRKNATQNMTITTRQKNEGPCLSVSLQQTYLTIFSSCYSVFIATSLRTWQNLFERQERREYEQGFKKLQGQRDSKWRIKVQIQSLWSVRIHILFVLYFLCDSLGLDLPPPRTAIHNGTVRNDPHWNETQGVTAQVTVSQSSVASDRGAQPVQPCSQPIKLIQDRTARTKTEIEPPSFCSIFFFVWASGQM